MHPNLTITTATKNDVAGITRVHQSNLLSNLKNMDKGQLCRRGFLVTPISEEKFGFFISEWPSANVKVAKNGQQVVGYALAYGCDLLKAQEPQLLESLQIEPRYRACLQKAWAEDKILYLDQVAVDRDMGNGTGIALYLDIVKEAKAREYLVIADMVLMEPIRNQNSYQLHGRTGAERIGTQNLEINGQRHIWSVWARELKSVD